MASPAASGSSISGSRSYEMNVRTFQMPSAPILVGTLLSVRSLLGHQGLGHKEGIRDQGVRGERFEQSWCAKAVKGRQHQGSLRSVVVVFHNDAERPTEKW